MNHKVPVKTQQTWASSHCFSRIWSLWSFSLRQNAPLRADVAWPLLSCACGLCADALLTFLIRAMHHLGRCPLGCPRPYPFPSVYIDA